MSFYETAKYTAYVGAGVVLATALVSGYIGYMHDRKIKKSEKRAKESKLEKIAKEK